MIEIVCDGMNATKTYTREAGDIKALMQITKRHIANDPDNWVIVRNEKASYMIMQEGGSKYSIYDMKPGTVMNTQDDIVKAVEMCYNYLTKAGK